jgi:hypothetical protein
VPQPNRKFRLARFLGKHAGGAGEMTRASPSRPNARGVDNNDAFRQHETQLTQRLECVDFQAVDVGDENFGGEFASSGYVKTGNDRIVWLTRAFQHAAEQMSILGIDGGQTTYAGHNITLSGRRIRRQAARRAAFFHRNRSSGSNVSRRMFERSMEKRKQTS